MRRCADSIELANLEPIADQFDLLAGYDDGNWPDADAIAQKYPGKTVIRITTNPADDEGDMLDIENGDAAPADGPGWIVRRRAAGHGGPLIYCSESNRTAVVGAFQAAALALPGLFIAAIPGDGAALQDPRTDVGHQWAYHGTYDESVVVDYLPGIDLAPSVPGEEVDMIRLVCADPAIHAQALLTDTHFDVLDVAVAGNCPAPVWDVDAATWNALKANRTVG